MSIVPEILRNPNNSIFNLEEAEIYSFKEAHELIALGNTHIHFLHYGIV